MAGTMNSSSILFVPLLNVKSPVAPFRHALDSCAASIKQMHYMYETIFLFASLYISMKLYEKGNRPLIHLIFIFIQCQRYLDVCTKFTRHEQNFLGCIDQHIYGTPWHVQWTLIHLISTLIASPIQLLCIYKPYLW